MTVKNNHSITLVRLVVNLLAEAETTDSVLSNFSGHFWCVWVWVHSKDVWRTSCTALWPGQEWDERSL